MEKLAAIIGPIIAIAMVGIFFITAAAYFEGTEVWFGWGWLLSLVIFVVACLFQGIGGLFLTVVAFYGMWKGWGWAWWQAFLIAFPGVTFSAVSLLGGGVAALFSSLTRGRRTPPQTIEY